MIQFFRLCNTNRWYSPQRLSGETHPFSSSSCPFIFGIPDMTDIFSSSIVDPIVGLSGVPGGTTIPFHADHFGSGHIAPSTPFVGGIPYTSYMHTTRIPSSGGDPRYVNIGGTSYILSYVPLYSIHVPLKVFFMTHPPYNPRGSLGRKNAYIHVVPSSFGYAILGGYLPHYVSWG